MSHHCGICHEPISKPHASSCPNRAHYGVKAKPADKDKK